MNENDLRVIKTKESIEEALETLLKDKPIHKITVAELARVARINKGTFYLHYLDIFDLYKKTILNRLDATFANGNFFADFFDAPERFMVQLDHAIMAGLPDIQTLSQGQSELLLMGEVLNRLRAKIYETGRLAPSIENDMKLDAIFGAILSYMPKYYSNYKSEASALAASMIKLFFPPV